MSLTIQHGGNTITPRSGPIRDGGQVIRVTPTVIAGTTHDNDVMFATTEIPNAVKTLGGVSKLITFNIIDYGREAHDMDLVFMQVSKDIGTAGSSMDITDADIVLAKFLSVTSIDWTDYSNLIGAHCAIYSAQHGGAGTPPDQVPVLWQAEPNSTSIYFAAVARQQIDWGATDDLEFVFHVEYL